MRMSLWQIALIIALLGALFGVYQWFGSGLGIISALTPTRLLPYVTWASIPTVITILFSITTRRVAVSSGMTNIFLVTAILFYHHQVVSGECVLCHASPFLYVMIEERTW